MRIVEHREKMKAKEQKLKSKFYSKFIYSVH